MPTLTLQALLTATLAPAQRLFAALPRGDGQRLTAEEGFSTAELLGNAALGILALLAIWTVLSDQGSQLVSELLSRVTAD